jgi:TonB-linked SusC/RagA family outer membrane protein
MRYIFSSLVCIIFSCGLLFAQEEIDSVARPAGYLLQERAGISGSVSVVDTELLTAIPADNTGNLLQGRAAGVNVIGSGQPGEASRVRIRGFSSFLDNNPLYVVDGVPTRDISFLNPNDVEKLTILKDAGSAAVYGSRASNGVIVITTRRGDQGFNVDYDMSLGVQFPGKGTRDDVLTAEEYADLQWLVYDNDGAVEVHPIYGLSQNPSPTMPSWAANTDWYDEITDPALIMNHDLSFSGGSENAKFYAGFGAFRQNGIVLFTHNTRYSARLNSDFSLFKNRIKAGESLSISYHDKLCVPNLNDNCPIQQGPYRLQSIIPVKWTGPDFVGMTRTFTEGDWGGTGIAPRLGNAPNVVAERTRNKDDYLRDLYLTGSIYLDVMIIEGLNFRSTLGGNRNKTSLSDYTYPTYENSENIFDTSLVENTIYKSDWVWTNSLTFSKQFGQHNINAIVGYEAVTYDIGQVESNVDSMEYTPTRILSTFINADYSFGDRYKLNATLRRDGCSRFPESDRYGLFPSISAGWMISNESFMSGLEWLSKLNIRASWGQTGNQYALSPMNAVYQFDQSIGGSWYDLYGTFTSAVMGYYPVKIGNPDARWETATITDIGFDAEFLNNKIAVIFDWYSKKATDLLYNTSVPATSGLGDPPYVNVASMKNNGVDMELTYRNKWGDFGLNTSFLLTAYRNKICEITSDVEYFDSGSSRIGSFVRNEAGNPLSSFYGYRVIGLFRNQNEVDNAPTQDGAAPGYFRYADIDADDYLDRDDKTILGDPNPKFTYGLNLALAWKNFDLTAFFYGSKGNDIFNYNKWWTDFWPSFQGQKSKDLLYNSWTTSNQDATVPRATNSSNFSTNLQPCSYYIEDGSYLRLKSFVLGYNIPQTITGKIHIKSLHVYMQVVNLFTITGYSGLDPELGGSDLAFGIDYGNYPNVKQLLFGIKLTL